MANIVKLMLIIFLVYAFQGVLSFFPFAFGVAYNVILFPLHFIENNFYPVGSLPYLFLGGSLIALIGFFVIRLFNKE